MIRSKNGNILEITPVKLIYDQEIGNVLFPFFPIYIQNVITMALSIVEFVLFKKKGSDKSVKR